MKKIQRCKINKNSIFKHEIIFHYNLKSRYYVRKIKIQNNVEHFKSS